jgi:hypothetical protein
MEYHRGKMMDDADAGGKQWLILKSEQKQNGIDNTRSFKNNIFQAL